MSIIQKSLKLKPDRYYEQHLEIINAILPAKLTSKEIKVLAVFLSTDKKLTEEDMFNAIVRKKVMAKLDLSPGGLGNHLGSMIKKGFLEKNEITSKITVKKYLFPKDNVQGYQFKLIKEIVKNETDK